MHNILLPFFIIKLVLSLLPFSFKALHLVIKPYFGLVLFLFVVSLYMLSFTKSLEKTFFTNETDTTPETTELPIEKKAEIEEQLDVTQEQFLLENHRVLYQYDKQLITSQTLLQDLLSQNPTHRDLLLNLAILESEQGNSKAARSHLELLEYVDPNNNFLKK